MAILKNRAKMSTSTTGTGTITLGSAESGYQTFADAGVANADVVRYVIEDGNNWEIGTGTYTATGTTLSRTVSESSNSDAAINLSGSATVFIGATAEDIPALYADNDVSATAPSAAGDNSVAIGSNASTPSGNTGAHSISIGRDAFARNQFNVAIGRGAEAGNSLNTGSYSGAFGHNSLAYKQRSIALGTSRSGGDDSLAAAITNNTSTYGATDANTIAVGYQAKANAAYATSIGYNNTASGIGAAVLGATSSTSSGFRSLVVGGLSNTASGSYASVLGGQSNTASEAHAIAMGDGSTASHANSVSIGDSVQSTATNQINLGGTADTVRISETYTLPTTDGTANQVLTTNGSGVVTFADAGGGGADLFAENYDGTSSLPSATGTNAVAIGRANATGADAMALGLGATATNTSSVALGLSRSGGTHATSMNTVTSSSSYGALGNNSIAGQYIAKASGTRAIAFGNESQATNTNSIAIGNSTLASGSGALALGNDAHATDTNAVSIGKSARASQNQSTAIGENNTASGVNSIAVGPYAGTASGNYSICMSTDTSSATAAASVAIGDSAVSNIIGAIKFASGRFDISSRGQAQGGQFILRADTTDATATVLTTNNSTAAATNQIAAPVNDTCITFDGTITAMQNGAQAYASWKIEGLLVNDGGTTTLANSATTVISNGSSWGMALSADNTNNALAITCTGEASHNIRWVANIRTTEVTYA